MKYTLLTLFLLLTFAVCGQKSARIKELETQRNKALADIELTNKLLEETSRSAQNSLNRLNLLSQQILSRKKIINLLNEEVKAIDKEMTDINQHISSLEKELQGKKDNYAKSVQGLYKRHNSQDKLLFILSADNFTQSLRRIRYLQEYSAWQKRQAKEIIVKQEEINREKEELEKRRTGKQTLLAERESENKKLSSEEATQKTEVQQLTKKQKELQADLKKKRQQAQNLNQQIEKQIAAEIARAEAEKKKGKGTEQRTADSKGGYAMTKAEKQLSDNFASNRGKLPFPVTGRYTIVSTFGEHAHPQLKNVRVYNNGIDIQTTPGTDARAVFNGEVTSIFVVPGYNTSVIIRHGNYLTVYSNLSEVYVKKGDKVATQQAIGKIFTDTQDSNSTILHFELRKEKEKLNPRPWLD
ncbi:MAG: peptidoglycan DD-metalloendopeptidase family protein [Tannerellaceae bacterium]|nr:peptidoglycan DD-metalloendopeptidase family protein [Tannerellaceae bacterium]